MYYFILSLILLSSPQILPVTYGLEKRPHSLNACDFVHPSVESTTTGLATPLTCFKFMWLCHYLQETLSLCWSGADNPLTHLAVPRLTKVIYWRRQLLIFLLAIFFPQVFQRKAHAGIHEWPTCRKVHVSRAFARKLQRDFFLPIFCIFFACKCVGQPLMHLPTPVLIPHSI